jgi:hypothetical protein
MEETDFRDTADSGGRYVLHINVHNESYYGMIITMSPFLFCVLL